MMLGWVGVRWERRRKKKRKRGGEGKGGIGIGKCLACRYGKGREEIGFGIVMLGNLGGGEEGEDRVGCSVGGCGLQERYRRQYITTCSGLSSSPSLPPLSKLRLSQFQRLLMFSAGLETDKRNIQAAQVACTVQ